MLGIHDFDLFVIAGILLNLAPGQDTFYILGRSIAGGRQAGVISVFGVSTGTVIHTIAAALGLSTLLATSASAFTIVKFAGAAYLIYLGVRMLLSKSEPIADPKSSAAIQSNAWTIYRQGVLSNVLNPKVALFFLAFLPQFIDADSGHSVLAFLVLGGTFVATGTMWCLVLAIGAAHFREFFIRTPSARTLLDRCIGGLFIALGVRLAVAR
jgi:threonine/homoserine/homoserine lactone efflux protein